MEECAFSGFLINIGALNSVLQASSEFQVNRKAKKMKNSQQTTPLLSLAALLIFTLPSVAVSLDLVVDRNDDSSLANACTEAPADCSLRGAIGLADSFATDEAISFDPEVFRTDSVILLNSGVLVVAGNGRLSIDGSAAPFITVNAQDLRGVFEIRSGAHLSVSDLTITGGNGVLQGGGAFFSRGTLELVRVSLIGNRAGTGGAIFNSEGTLTIDNSTICNNRSSAGAISSLGTLASTTIKDSTICFNLSNFGGGIYQSSFATVSLENTIVANNTAGTGPDVLGTIFSAGFNLFSNSSGLVVNGPATADQYDVDPLLDPTGPADHGGSSFTVALLKGSPAIDTGNSSSLEDQRNETRPVDDPDSVDGAGNLADVGSFEFQPVVDPPPPPPPGPAYDFQGFQKPLDPGKVNRLSAGAAVPVRFSLTGFRGMNIFLEGFPASVEISCDSGEVVGDPSSVVLTGGGLRYDPDSDFYSFNWRTERGWRRSCRRFLLGLNDGSALFVDFSFR